MIFTCSPTEQYLDAVDAAFFSYFSGLRTIQAARFAATSAPNICATMKPVIPSGRIPAKVGVSDRASVTAGFANDVDAVNQYAAVIYAATVNGTALAL